MDGISAGLSAIAFWGFIAVVVAFGIWDRVRKRETQHETFRRMVDAGRDINQEELDALVAMSDRGTDNLDRDLKVGGIIMLSIAPGLALLGWFLAVPKVLFGVALLVLCVAFGLLIAARVVSETRD